MSCHRFDEKVEAVKREREASDGRGRACHPLLTTERRRMAQMLEVSEEVACRALSHGRGRSFKRPSGAGNALQIVKQLRLCTQEAVKTMGSLGNFDSVLRVVCWGRDTKSLHLVKQRGAL